MSPYGANQFSPEEQLPYGYTLATATPPSDKNGPGFAALIIGIVSVVAAFIPFLNFISFLLGPAGIICGIIGLVLTARPRRQAIWGTVLSGVSMIIAFVLIFVYTFGFIFGVFGVISETTRELPRSTEVATAPPFATPADAVPLGTVVELLDANGTPVYEATVTASVLDATDQVLGEARNIEAPAGMQWALARVTVTPLTDVATAVAADIAVEFVSSDGDVFSPADQYVVVPEPAFEALSTAAVGSEVTGNVVIAVPADDADGGFWALSSVLAGSAEEPFYFPAK